MTYRAQPMDVVELPDGRRVTVNSAHYFDMAGGKYRQMFSACEPVQKGAAPPLYYADECRLIRGRDAV